MSAAERVLHARWAQVRTKAIAVMRALAVSSLVALAACGGSGGNRGPAPAPAAPGAEGLWTGSTNTSRSVTAIVLDNGTYWMLYSLPRASSLIAGVVQGTGSPVNGAFTSSDGIDFNLEGQGINNATLAASYAVRQSFDGSVSYPNLNPAFTFTSTYNTDYDQTPSVSAIAGTYTGIASVAGGDEPATIVVNSLGLIAGAGIVVRTGTAGCQFAGTVVPRAKGNLYDLSVIVSGVGACISGPGTVKGIGYFDASANRFYVAALDKPRSDGLIFVGIKS